MFAGSVSSVDRWPRFLGMIEDPFRELVRVTVDTRTGYANKVLRNDQPSYQDSGEVSPTRSFDAAFVVCLWKINGSCSSTEFTKLRDFVTSASISYVRTLLNRSVLAGDKSLKSFNDEIFLSILASLCLENYW